VLLPLLQSGSRQDLLLMLVLYVQVQGLVELLLDAYGFLCFGELCCICCQVHVKMEPLGARLATLHAAKDNQAGSLVGFMCEAQVAT
jgi:hypothetical protein